MTKRRHDKDPADEDRAAGLGADPAPPTEPENLPEPADEAGECERLRGELAALKDRCLRVQAEFDNYRKRQQREAEEVRRQAKERILRELPPVMDNLERAVRHGGENAAREHLVQGVELVLKQFVDILTRYGVEPIRAVGATFDPHLHEAMARVDTTGEPPDGTVVEEYQRGFLLDGKVLRPALVAVAKTVAEDRDDEE